MSLSRCSSKASFRSESGALEALLVVDRGAAHELQALAVHQQLQAVALEDDVALALLVEGELVLEARASPAAHAHAQPGHAHVRLLGGEKLVHLLGALVCDLDHRSAPVDGSKTFQSIAPARPPLKASADPLR